MRGSKNNINRPHHASDLSCATRWGFFKWNEYSVKCKIVENNQTLFEVQVYAGTREQAKKIADNWNNNAEEIYPQILEILAKN